MISKASTGLLAAALMLGQAPPRPEFDAASLKPTSSGPPPGFPSNPDFGGREPGRYRRARISLKVALQLAFQMAPYQISGPAWIESDRFDILATMPPTTTDSQVLQMLQNLLIDRFKIQFHREQKEQPAYVLVVGKNGTNLKPVECLANAIVRMGPRGIEAKSRTFRDLAAILMRWEDRPVVDGTGLAGCYDFALEFGEGVANGASVAPSVEPLGLKMEPRKHPIDYLIIDRAQRIPVEN